LGKMSRRKRHIEGCRPKARVRAKCAVDGREKKDHKKEKRLGPRRGQGMPRQGVRGGGGGIWREDWKTVKAPGVSLTMERSKNNTERREKKKKGEGCSKRIILNWGSTGGRAKAKKRHNGETTKQLLKVGPERISWDLRLSPIWGLPERSGIRRKLKGKSRGGTLKKEHISLSEAVVGGKESRMRSFLLGARMYAPRESEERKKHLLGPERDRGSFRKRENGFLGEPRGFNDHQQKQGGLATEKHRQGPHPHGGRSQTGKPQGKTKGRGITTISRKASAHNSAVASFLRRFKTRNRKKRSQPTVDSF